MTKIFRFASAAALLLGAASLGSGCVVGDCQNPDGTTRENCVSLEPATFFNGSEVTQSVAYVAGTAVEIRSTNGNVDVKVGGGTEVSVTFKPFSGRAKDDKDAAVRDMKEDLEISATESGGKILVNVSKKSGSNDLLGAHMVVTLPASFDGAFSASVNNGDVEGQLGSPASTTIDAHSVDVSGAAGALNVNADFEIKISIAEWSATGGSITGGRDITVGVPTGANGTLTATSGDEATVTAPSPLPSDWQETATSDYQKSYALGDGSGGTVTVTTDFFSSEVTLQLN